MKFQACLVCLSLFLSGQAQQRRVGAIEFFGYKGFDLSSIRSGLSLRVGDNFPGALPFPDWKQQIRENIRQVIHQEATDVGIVCCDHPNGNYMIYIGLPGSTSKPMVYNSAPDGASRLPAEVLAIDEEMGNALRAAVMTGGNSTKEDDSQGYALTTDPAVQVKQLAMRVYALQHESLLTDVLQSSADAQHRAIAATALGYGPQSVKQVATLVKASLDPDDRVRNNAVRALGVLASAKPDLAQKISAETFIELLTSGQWTDRNKGMFVLDALTKRRDPELLKELRLKALDALIEMARWKTDHALAYRFLLGRIANIEELKLSEMAKNGEVETIIDALPKAR